MLIVSFLQGSSHHNNSSLLQDQQESESWPSGVQSQEAHPSLVLFHWHGRQHTIMPSKVNYQANIWALKEEGCTHVIVTTACGSLREEVQPGDIVIIDQFIDSCETSKHLAPCEQRRTCMSLTLRQQDSRPGGEACGDSRTTTRPQTFYDGSRSCARGVCHIPMAEPFCPKTREVLIETAKKLGLRCHSKGTMITIEGPRFSSRAESLMFRTWGADVINMTTVPEVVLAKEAGICYASIAMATDYDCWKEHEEAVSVDRVLKTLKENANKATSVLLTTIPQIGSMEWSETLHNLKVSVFSHLEISDTTIDLQPPFSLVDSSLLFYHFPGFNHLQN
ncbi:S-methyl-5'-thioadenosine phosphorylase isoform X2 [Elephas maximus indicus]|uniref:S-methyl-5'-thioadenosine phosphorylase isoform X2 n=1 Tax=Elephas maximus indicus TaxID=99487 RepID=UPI00211660BC|nr:S-methyl-5'-thioadenosine phosphorylase isoform X2 [Elephas maximus indicus]